MGAMSIVGVKNPKKRLESQRKQQKIFLLLFLWDSHGQYTYFGHEK